MIIIFWSCILLYTQLLIFKIFFEKPKTQIMNYKTEVEKINFAIEALKILKRELIATDKKSETCFKCDGTIRQRQKASADLNWQCMALDKQRKATYKTILAADLKVSLDDCEYNPSGFHNYKHKV